MDQKNLDRLEYYKIAARLADCTSFGVSREMAGKLMPLTNASEIILKQQETDEARQLLRYEPEIPLGGLRDIRGILRKVSIGGILEPPELLETGDMLFAMRRLKGFLREREDRYPITSRLTQRLCVLKEIEDLIRESIEPGGEISDKASPELRRLRNKIRELQASVKERMDSIIRSQEYQKYLQDPIITVRCDRFVVPVKQEYRVHFSGIVHDQSASGATLFIEPMAVVEKNNELRRVMTEEKQEIIRILSRISGCIRGSAAEIGTGLEAAGEIDFIIAKGKLSSSMDAGAVNIVKGQGLEFRSARHPLLGENAVPVSVRLGKDFGILVITGPNTGGKTVALKTVGLLVLMAQSGLHIPAETGSETGIFTRVFADIGDEQSIEQSLSTFSSHMTNIINILNEVDSRSLVLLDELGAGTDPAEGAALAMAILDYLEARQVRTIATTHYSELKAFAFNRPGVENASVEFDIKTLRPTYRLIIGRPGSSSAFEIAGRLGLKNEIIDIARQALSKENIQVTGLLRELEDNRRASEQELNEAARLKEEVRKLRQEYEKKLDDLSAKRAEVLEKTRREAGETLRRSRLEADALIKQIKDAMDGGADARALAAAHDARSRLKKLRQEGDEDEYIAGGGDTPRNVKPGQEVFLPRYNQTGQVLSGTDSNGMVLVRVGVMKLSLPISELRIQKVKQVSLSETGGPRVMAGKAREIASEIDLRGMTVDEALEAVEKYLDDACLAGLSKACIIHGKGTGALRKAITDLLSRHRFVKSHRLGQFGEGGTGVTVVEIK